MAKRFPLLRLSLGVFIVSTQAVTAAPLPAGSPGSNISTTIGRAEARASRPSARAYREWVVMASAMDPFPAVVGFGVRWNAQDWLQLGGDFGYGDPETGSFAKNPWSTYAGALSAKLGVPGWNLTPTLGVGHSWIWLKGRDAWTGARAQLRTFTWDLGLAWQSWGGMSVAAGVHLPMGQGAERVAAAFGTPESERGWLRTMPYVSVGWAF
jgi:hypothetical protein